MIIKLYTGGWEGMGKTTFHVLSLKSNVWKHVGHVNYTFTSVGVVQIGTLCNGALHWVMCAYHDINLVHINLPKYFLLIYPKRFLNKLTNLMIRCANVVFLRLMKNG